MKIKQNITARPDEALFFIDLNDLLVYRRKRNKTEIRPAKDIKFEDKEFYIIDKDKSQEKYEQFKKTFCQSMQQKCTSLKETNVPLNKSGTKISVLENKVCKITFEDNNWAIAVKLSPQENCNKGVLKQTYNNFFRHMKESLLEQLSVIYVRNGSLTVSPVNQTPLNYGNYIELEIDSQEN
jgi:hypothetical protein